MDLDGWYAAGRWVGLVELIDMLPAASRFNEAIANDPEMARELARLPKPEGEWSPRVSEFGLQEQMFQMMISQLIQIKQSILASAGEKPTPEKSFPSPVTEIDRAMKAMEREWAEDFVSQFGFDATDI